jgi:Resolvase, N terminal domain/Helix-turn-helix domain of resolvase
MDRPPVSLPREGLIASLPNLSGPCSWPSKNPSQNWKRCKELQENSRDHDESPIGEYAANDPLPKGRIGWSAHGRLMLTVLGGLAEFERELIRSRTSEGRERAKAKGVVMGRKPKLTHHQRQEAIARRDAGEPLVDIGRSYNVSHSTISRL